MPPVIAPTMDEAEAVSRAFLLDTATVAAAAGKVDEHSVGYISASPTIKCPVALIPRLLS